MSVSANTMRLAIVDTTGIQKYIFGTNTLRHHMGASWLVDWATQGAVNEVIFKLKQTVVTNIDQSGTINPKERIEAEEQKLDVELLYTGGGNAVLLFRTKELAVAFAKELSRTVLATAPGLQMVISHQDFSWNESLADKLGELRHAANRKKHDRRHSMPLLGLGVTADCQFTDLPAEGEWSDGDGNSLRISGEVKAKWEHANHAMEHLNNVVRMGMPGDRALPKDVEFIYDFDEIGSRDESSFLAVVHIDGNGMGQRFKAIADAHRDPRRNRAYIQAIRQLSDRVRDISNCALCSAVLALQRSRKQDDQGNETIGGTVPLRRKNGKHDAPYVLPFRPIVYGGDDVTFVCDGRLGLTLAAHYLQAMEQPLDTDGNDHDRLYVRAGIAVVNNHYPFSRAYELAEDLAGSAKQYIQENAPDKQLSALDWHFAVNGLVLPLDKLRTRDYTTKDGNLLMRPILSETYGDDKRWRTWPFFASLMGNFLDNSDWADSRNKILGYREALRNGPEAARQFLKAFVTTSAYLAAPPDHEAVKACGWLGERSVHFDAVEAVDFFIRLRTVESEDPEQDTPEVTDPQEKPA